MKTLVTADWHLNANPRDAYRYQTIASLTAIIRKHRIGCLLILGDLTDEKDYHGAVLVNDVVEVIRPLADMCETIILRGNHDYRDPKFPFFRFLDRLPGVNWINTPKTRFVEGLGNCLFLPHTTNYKRDWKGIELSGLNWIFAHNTFEGARGDNNRVLSGIPPTIFNEHSVISGDVHGPQSVAHTIMYVGAPYTINFGDDYSPRVLLLEGSQIRSIPVPGPRKVLVNTDASRNLPSVTIKAHDIVKARYHLREGEYAKWATIKTQLREAIDSLGAVLWAIEPVPPKVGAVAKPSKTVARTDEQILQQYGKRMSIDERTLKTGALLMQKSK